MNHLPMRVDQNGYVVLSDADIARIADAVIARQSQTHAASDARLLWSHTKPTPIEKEKLKEMQGRMGSSVGLIIPWTMEVSFVEMPRNEPVPDLTVEVR